MKEKKLKKMIRLKHQNQNHLPLTSELSDFLKHVSENKNNKKEYEIVGNF